LNETHREQMLSGRLRKANRRFVPRSVQGELSMETLPITAAVSVVVITLELVVE
jgi:hypothetical protein